MNKKILIIITILVIAITCGAFFLMNRKKPQGYKVDLVIVPSKAKVSIDGSAIKGKTVYLNEGTHTFKAELDGFKTAETKAVVKKDRPVVLGLEPISKEAKDWATKNQDLYLKAEGVEGERANEVGKELSEKNPIIGRLPYGTSYYYINYGDSETRKGEIRIRITAENALGRQVALERIRSWGFDPTDYEIIFAGYSNPFDPNEVQGE